MAEITVLNNGPLRVKGDVTLKDAEGNVYGLGGRDAISLCRCGHSENKPFCDGSDGAHNRHEFRHDGEAFDLPERKE